MGQLRYHRPAFLSSLIGMVSGKIRCGRCGKFVRPRLGLCPNCSRWMDRRVPTSAARKAWGGIVILVAAAAFCVTMLVLRREKALRALKAAEPPEPTPRIAATSRSQQAVALVHGHSGVGTGFLVGHDLLATNAHVILLERIEDLRVSFPSAPGAPLPARLLFEDPSRDLALLAVSTSLTPLEIEPADRFREGREVIVIGHPGSGDRPVNNAERRGVLSAMTTIRGQDFFRLSISIALSQKLSSS